MKRHALVGLLLIGLAVPTVLAQSSPNYRVTGGVADAAGETASPSYQAQSSGAAGAPAQTASSPNFSVVVSGGGSAGDDPTIFHSGFE